MAVYSKENIGNYYGGIEMKEKRFPEADLPEYIHQGNVP